MEDFSSFSRRDFMKGAGALGITGLAIWSGACESACKKIKDRPTRRNIANLAANDPIIQTYKDAVAAMKALPAADGRNWNKQADIHNNKCPHQNWWFLPWHRAYLANFESICRKLTGNADFALPYWNWTTSTSIPAPFWGAGNPLMNSTRSATQTSVASASNVGATKINEILGQTNFFLFASAAATTQRQRTAYGMLESTPHNYIHNFVGGDMLTFRSPLDPVFWCHHNMVECLWVHWNLDMGNANTSDPVWGNLEFTDDFVDGDGNPAPIKVSTTLLYPLLTYQYEPCAPGMAKAAVSRDKATLEKFLREGAPHKLEFIKRYELRRPTSPTLLQAAPSRLKVEPDAFRTVLDVAGREKAVLTIDEVEPPSKQDVFVRVFVNKPDANASTSIDDPHYAGSFAFFCCEDDAMKGHDMSALPTPKPGATPPTPESKLPKLTYLVDVTPTIRKLGQAGSLSPDLDVTLVTVPIEDNRRAETQRLNLGRIELAVARF